MANFTFGAISFRQGNEYYFIITVMALLMITRYANEYSFDYAEVMLVSNYITNQIS